MIRPSLLPLAQHCGYAVKLAQDFPSSSEASERGTRFHAAMAAYIKTRVGPAELAAMFATLPPHVEAKTEAPLILWDPDAAGEPDDTCTACAPIRTMDRSAFIHAYNSGKHDLLCQEHPPALMGHADVVLVHDEGSLTVVDWKTGVPDKVDPPGDNLQLLAYGIAAAMERGAPRFRVGLYFTDHPPLRLSGWIHDGQEYWDVLARIRSAMTQPRNEPKTGGHCDRCYQRRHCHAWALVAARAEGELATATPQDLTDGEKVGRLVMGIDALKERIKIMKAHCEDYARNNDVVIDGKRWAPRAAHGRRSLPLANVEQHPDLLAEVERRGLINEGRPYEVFAWTNAKGKAGQSNGCVSQWLEREPPKKAKQDVPKKRQRKVG